MELQTAVTETKKAASAGLPVLLLGPPGIGKTTVARMVASDLGLPYVEVRPAEFESVDFRGIPTVEAGRTRWNVPDFWPSERSLLNVDEITQAAPELTSPLLKLFLGGAVGDYQLPEGTVLMATGNRVGDRAGCSRISSALRERCVVIELEPSYLDWMDWFHGQEFYDPDLPRFLDLNRAMFHAWDARLDHNQPTPRNWARVARLLPFDPEPETVAGIIGQSAAEAFMKWRRANQQLPSVLDVYNKKKPLPKSPAMMARFVELMAESTDETAEEALAVVHELHGTWQVQFLKHVSKYAPERLKRPTYKALVAKHAAAIVASR
jgi:DNA polymerase III delta prime subunit